MQAGRAWPCFTVQHQGLPGSAQTPPMCLPQATNARSTLAVAQAAAVEVGQEGTMGSPGNRAGEGGTGLGDRTRERPELRWAEGGSPLL